MSHEPDRERIRRIQERQLADRNPGDSKIKGYDWDKHFEKKRQVDTRRKKEAKRPLLFTLWEALPSRWKGFGYGFCLGTIIGITLLFFVPPEWRMVFVIPQLVGAVMGLILGKVLDSDLKIQ